MADFHSLKATQPAASTVQFGRPANGLAVVGVLTPVDLTTYQSQIRLEHGELVIGRGQRSDGIDLQLPDTSISRRHARIRKVDDHFVIEDLGSSNGTFVDGIPIRMALLHDGDRVRIGKTVFFFDHVLEFGEDIEADPLSDSGSRRPFPAPNRGAAGDVMTVAFWGTRGSLPTPGSVTRKYGGNTTCVEVRYRDSLVVVDAGSGISELSRSWQHEFSDAPIHAHLLLTHLHWDHIQGFPFFSPAYREGNRIDIYSTSRGNGSTQELLSGQMEQAYFPVPISAMKAELQFFEATNEFAIGDLKIESIQLPHPGGCVGYRFTAGDSVFVFATDCELDNVALNQDVISKDAFAPREYDPALLRWMESADLLVIDCQYTEDEYRERAGWGHNSIATVIDLCRQVRPRRLALFHHDPMSSDAIITQRVHRVAQSLIDLGVEETLPFGAREQLCLEVAKSRTSGAPESSASDIS